MSKWILPDNFYRCITSKRKKLISANNLIKSGRSHHKNKHVDAAIEYAIKAGWKLIKGKGHCWGRLYCPGGGCRCSIYGTPRNYENHAKRIYKKVDKCSC